MTALKIPSGPHEVTPAWLTEALRSTETISNSAVISIQTRAIGGIEGGTGPMVRLHPTYDAIEEGAPSSLIAKFPSSDPRIRTTLSQQRTYEKEIRFYEEIADLVELRTPKRYYSAMNTAMHEYVLLLEDLAPARVGDDKIIR